MSSEFARRVSEVPLAYEKTDRSTACLLKEAGLPAQDGLSVDDVTHVLEEEPRLADLWLQRGADQRVGGGWGIESSDGVYKIKNFSDGGSFAVQNRVRACAEFMVRYVGHIRGVLARNG
jgi:hypothetical protein